MQSSISRPSKRADTAKRRALIYFVCGNPGLIEFYIDFFDCLRALLDASEGETCYDIYGRNLLGFSDEEHEPFSSEKQPWDLNGQVEGIYDDVALQSTAGRTLPYDSVILMGHSVGAYIAVEVFHRHMKNPGRAPHLNLRHGFLLFPTLTFIGQSPSGKKMSLLQHVPLLENSIHRIAQLALSVVSEGTLRWITSKFMGFPPKMADLLARWLKSRDGVWQALHLGLCEMREIRQELWEEELWEVTDGSNDTKAPKFFFFYGKDDHWVANHIRDEFIEKRRLHGEQGGRTQISIDESGLKHAFCTREDESLAVAHIVHGWVDEIESGRSI